VLDIEREILMERIEAKLDAGVVDDEESPFWLNTRIISQLSGVKPPKSLGPPVHAETLMALFAVG
jgi:hypothetical protein